MYDVLSSFTLIKTGEPIKAHPEYHRIFKFGIGITPAMTMPHRKFNIIGMSEIVQSNIKHA